MKKIFIVCAMVCALGLVSCNNNKEYCWEYTIKLTDGNDFNTEQTSYVWGTKKDVKEAMDEAKKNANHAFGDMCKCTLTGPRKTIIDDAYSCDDNNEHCWEYTFELEYIGFGIEQTSYTWGTRRDVEEAMRETEEEINSTLGDTGKCIFTGLRKTNINDIYSCAAQIAQD